MKSDPLLSHNHLQLYWLSLSMSVLPSGQRRGGSTTEWACEGKLAAGRPSA